MSIRAVTILGSLMLAALPAFAHADGGSAALHGAIFTTDSLCDGERVHRFDLATDVRLDSRMSADPDEADDPDGDGAALPDGEYYVAVTDPKGDLLGTSVGAPDETPLAVVGGAATACVDLSTALRRVSDGTAGFDPSPSRAGVYKVLVSTTSDFEHKFTVKRTFRVAARHVDSRPSAE